MIAKLMVSTSLVNFSNVLDIRFVFIDVTGNNVTTGKCFSLARKLIELIALRFAAIPFIMALKWL